jgi:drug/metabolite transporter (DMT)-like permease
MNRYSARTLGIIFAITAAVFWGLSGTFVQFLIETREIEIEWLVTVRLLVAGVLLIAYSQLKGNDIWQPWRSKQSVARLLTFGLLGMLSIQYTYFATIKHSNAATATVLQYLGPVMIAVYLAFARKRWPSGYERIAIVSGALGAFLLVTHGQLGVLSISVPALFWGLSSAVALAFYTIQPAELLKRYDSATLIGWAMLIAGGGFTFVSQPWNVPGIWNTPTYFATGFIILFGTLAAFWLYIAAIKRIGPQQASLLAFTEPLSAALVAVVWLHAPFGLIDWIGTGFILAAIFVLSKADTTHV